MKRYLLMFYYSTLIQGFNEVGPVNSIEMGFAMLALLLGSMFNALIFGDIASLISILQQKKAEHQQFIDQSNISMDYIDMDESDR